VSVTPERLKSKFRGAFLGAAIGDALGAPYEGEAEASDVTLAQLLARTDVLAYTDDTHMTLWPGGFAA
jgi:poly(ADP-ribose) glycohydrolase ARH3